MNKIAEEFTRLVDFFINVYVKHPVLYIMIVAAVFAAYVFAFPYFCEFITSYVSFVADGCGGLLSSPADAITSGGAF